MGTLTPLKVVAYAAGMFLLVLGIVALARAGFPAPGEAQAHVAVGPFTRTPVMAIIEIVYGLLLLAAGSVPEDLGALTFLGLLALVFGIVWLIEPDAFNRVLGIHRGTGWLYLGLGAALTAAGLRWESLLRRDKPPAT